MRRESSLFLKLTVIILGLCAFAFCIASIPVAVHSENRELIPIFIVVYLSSLLFFYSVFQVLKLLHYADNNKAFSDLSVQSLRYIKFCALGVSLLFAAVLPWVYKLAQDDDAPGMVVIGMFFVGAPVVVATFAAVLEKILQDAIDLKAENDLTV